MKQLARYSSKLMKIGIGMLLLITLAGAYLYKLLEPPNRPLVRSSGNYVLRDVTIINPGFSRQDGIDLAIGDGRFIIPAASKGQLVTEYSGMYVLPGFIDAHTHMPGDNLLKLTRHYSLLHLAHGVTTIRDAGDIDGTAIPAARALARTGFPMPHLLSCGAFVSSPGHAVWPNSKILTSPKDAGEIVKWSKQNGHNCIKSYEGLSRADIAALTHAATREGIPVIGHVPVGMTLEQSGLPGAEHLFGVAPPEQLKDDTVVYRNGDWDAVTNERMDAVTQYIVDHDTRITPTLVPLASLLGYQDYEAAKERSERLMPSLFASVVWHPETGLPVYRGLTEAQLQMAGRALDKKRELLLRLSDNGAILRIGTDVGQPFTTPGESYWDELRHFAKAGISPEKVLEYATHIAADTIGSPAGRISANRPADYLIFAEDPTQSLDALDSLVAVSLDGNLYRSSDLNASIKQSLERYESPILRWISHRSAQGTIDKTARNF